MPDQTQNNKITLDTPPLTTQTTHTVPPGTSKQTSKESKANTPRSRSPVPMADLNIDTILKFVKSYDGSRDTLNAFITNCNNAHELASDAQKPILFKYILCQLTGKAEAACSIKEFSNWEQLKDFLKTQFGERKHISHLLADLQESKQLPAENVSQYSLRIETCLSQLLTETTLSNTKVKDLPGRTAAMEDLALHHFMLGLHPRISNIVRCRNPKNLNDAINVAVSEERIQQTLYKKHSNQVAPRRGVTPQSQGQSRLALQSSSNSAPRTHPTQLFCRYCKNHGHDISTCRKREFYNNQVNRTNQRPYAAQTQRAAPMHFVNDQEHQQGPYEIEYPENEEQNNTESNSLNE